MHKQLLKLAADSKCQLKATLMKPDINSIENSVDPDQLAPSAEVTQHAI